MIPLDFESIAKLASAPLLRIAAKRIRIDAHGALADALPDDVRNALPIIPEGKEGGYTLQELMDVYKISTEDVVEIIKEAHKAIVETKKGS